MVGCKLRWPGLAAVNCGGMDRKQLSITSITILVALLITTTAAASAAGNAELFCESGVMRCVML